MTSGKGDGELVAKIDLYNFEDPRYEDSRYVLTSPRSLEACSRLNVKPVELLYKPLTEFQEELLPQDVPLRTIYNIYDEQEQIRLRKLHLCREERNRINKSEVVDVKMTKSGIAALSDDGSTLTKESLQRQRTAWTVAATQQPNSQHSARCSKPWPCSGPLEQQVESTKLNHELLSRKDHQTRSSRQARSARSSPRTEKPTTGSVKLTRSKSASEIFSKLPARDQKILELMKCKREEEQRQLEESERTRLLWEDERRRHELLRAVMENKRRKMLAQQNNHKAGVDKLRESPRRHCGQENDLAKREYDILCKAKLTDDALYKQLVSQQQSVNNIHERQAFERRRRELEKDAARQEQGAHSLIELKHSQVEDNLANLMETRNQQLLAARLQEEKKQEKARQTQLKLEHEMEAWRQRLLRHQRQIEKQAEMAVKVNINSRAERARQERLSHQQEQQRNLAKLSKEHRRWKRGLLESMHEKDKKIIELQQQKEQFMAQTRSVAQMSQLLREQVRTKYESDTFDRKALEAQLFARLENRPSPRRAVSAS